MAGRRRSERFGKVAALATLILLTACKATNSHPPVPAPPAPLPVEDPDPNIRLVRAIAANRLDLVQKALADGASANFKTAREMVFPPGWLVAPISPLSAICIPDAARINAGPITMALLTAGADPNACAGRSLIGPHRDYSDVAPPYIAKSLIDHGYLPSPGEVEEAERTVEFAALRPEYHHVGDALLRLQVAKIVLSGKGPAIDEYQLRQAKAQEQAQLTLKKARETYAKISRGQTVCSVPGIYRQEYVAYVEDREEDRIQLRIAGSKTGILLEFKAQEIIWDGIVTWAPCEVSRR